MAKPLRDMPPSYSDITAISRISRHNLVERLTEARNGRIEKVIQSVINEILRQINLYAASATTLVLIPSDARAAGLEMQITLASGMELDDVRKVTQLHGAENTSSFWKQDSVIEELDRKLRRELWMTGMSPFSGVTQLQGKSPFELGSDPPRLGPFQRCLGGKPDINAQAPNFGLGRNLGWSSPTRVFKPSKTELSVRAEDISLRFDTGLLYDTRTIMAVVIEIAIGS